MTSRAYISRLDVFVGCKIPRKRTRSRGRNLEMISAGSGGFPRRCSNSPKLPFALLLATRCPILKQSCGCPDVSTSIVSSLSSADYQTPWFRLIVLAAALQVPGDLLFLYQSSPLLQWSYAARYGNAPVQPCIQIEYTALTAQTPLNCLVNIFGRGFCQRTKLSNDNDNGPSLNEQQSLKSNGDQGTWQLMHTTLGLVWIAMSNTLTSLGHTCHK